MSWLSGIIVYLLIWWTMIFTVLPWGLKRDPDGTPQNPMLKRKLLVTTGVSGLVWLLIFALIEAEIISFRAIAAAMHAEES